MASCSVRGSRTSPSTIRTRFGSGFASRRARRRYSVSRASVRAKKSLVVLRASCPLAPRMRTFTMVVPASGVRHVDDEAIPRLLLDHLRPGAVDPRHRDLGDLGPDAVEGAEADELLGLPDAADLRARERGAIAQQREGADLVWLGGLPDSDHAEGGVHLQQRN